MAQQPRNRGPLSFTRSVSKKVGNRIIPARLKTGQPLNAYVQEEPLGIATIALDKAVGLRRGTSKVKWNESEQEIVVAVQFGTRLETGAMKVRLTDFGFETENGSFVLHMPIRQVRDLSRDVRIKIWTRDSEESHLQYIGTAMLKFKSLLRIQQRNAALRWKDLGGRELSGRLVPVDFMTDDPAGMSLQIRKRKKRFKDWNIKTRIRVGFMSEKDSNGVHELVNLTESDRELLYAALGSRSMQRQYINEQQKKMVLSVSPTKSLFMSRIADDEGTAIYEDAAIDDDELEGEIDMGSDFSDSDNDAPDARDTSDSDAENIPTIYDMGRSGSGSSDDASDDESDDFVGDDAVDTAVREQYERDMDLDDHDEIDSSSSEEDLDSAGQESTDDATFPGRARLRRMAPSTESPSYGSILSRVSPSLLTGQRQSVSPSLSPPQSFKGADEPVASLGLLQLDLYAATGLPRLRNVLGHGYNMDPFVIIVCGSTVFRTRVVRHSLQPEWNERLFLLLKKPDLMHHVTFRLCDWDNVTSNNNIGEMSVSMKDFGPDSPFNGVTRTWPITLEPKILNVVGQDAETPLLTLRGTFFSAHKLRAGLWRNLLSMSHHKQTGRAHKDHSEDPSLRLVSFITVTNMLAHLESTLSSETIASWWSARNLETSSYLCELDVIDSLEAHIGYETEKPVVRSRGKSVEDDPYFLDESVRNDLLDEDNELASDLSELFPEYGENQDVENTSPSATASKTKSQGSGTPTLTATTSTMTSSSNATPSRQTPLAYLELVCGLRRCLFCRKRIFDSATPDAERIDHMTACLFVALPKRGVGAKFPTLKALKRSRSIRQRVMRGNFQTASQAQRKWITKIVSKATKGAYSAGAPQSANIIVLDRETGYLIEEKMQAYVRMGIRIAYQSKGFNLERQRMRQLLRSLSMRQGLKFDSPASQKDIAKFIRFHDLDMSDVLEPLSSFITFNQFFYRKLRPGTRPVHGDTDVLVSAADCRLVVFPSVDAATKIWIKGREFSIEKLIGSSYDARPYAEGLVAVFRLAPQDYHRFHSPVDGVCGPQSRITGTYYTVNPMAIRSSLDVFGENVRVVMPIESPVFGTVLCVIVGAMLVGSIVMTVKPGDRVSRGDELGFFSFGGSTIVLLIPPGRAVFDGDLVQNSQNGVETLVKMGTHIGRSY